MMESGEMPRGVHSGRGGPTYRGYPKIRMVRATNGFGTEAICIVLCSRCGWAMERRSRSIKEAERKGSSFVCEHCRLGTKRGVE